MLSEEKCRNLQKIAISIQTNDRITLKNFADLLEVCPGFLARLAAEAGQDIEQFDLRGVTVDAVTSTIASIIMSSAIANI